MNLSAILKNWSEKLRSIFASAVAKRPRGLMAMPGTMATVRSGQLKLPVIDWEKIYRKSFLYNSLALVVIAYFISDFLVVALSPYFPVAAPPRPRFSQSGEDRTIHRYDPILARNLFNERGLIPNADVGDSIDGPPVKTNLPLTLLGVIVIADPTKSVASVDDKGTNQVWAVRAGEMLGSNVQVEAIEPDRMIFLNKAERRREFVELPKDMIVLSRKASPAKPAAGGIQREGNRFNIDRKEVDKVMENFNEVVTQARCVPNFEAGRPAGYRCFQIEPGSIYEKLGMKENDVICGINGQPVNDPASAFNMLTTIKSASTRNIELCINRNGQVMNMQYDIN